MDAIAKRLTRLRIASANVPQRRSDNEVLGARILLKSLARSEQPTKLSPPKGEERVRYNFGFYLRFNTPNSFCMADAKSQGTCASKAESIHASANC